MNWMYALYATYEQNRDYVGRIDKEPAHGNRKERLITPLLPLYHSMQNAHITITLNRQGELIDASLNNQNSQPTISPLRKPQEDAPAEPVPTLCVTSSNTWQVITLTISLRKNPRPNGPNNSKPCRHPTNNMNSNYRNGRRLTPGMSN